MGSSCRVTDPVYLLDANICIYLLSGTAPFARRRIEAVEVGAVGTSAVTFAEVMTGLARDGMTMVVVTHEMGFARSAAQRVVFMADGRIVEVASPADFFTRPQSERAQDFLSKILSH